MDDTGVRDASAIYVTLLMALTGSPDQFEAENAPAIAAYTARPAAVQKYWAIASWNDRLLDEDCSER